MYAIQHGLPEDLALEIAGYVCQRTAGKGQLRTYSVSRPAGLSDDGEIGKCSEQLQLYW